MSIDINWDTLTGGPDGSARAESIRAFIHERFQQVTLPRFIRSVHVHAFDFGSVPPNIEIKDICDPLPDFYEEDEDYPDEDEGPSQPMGAESGTNHGPSRPAKERRTGRGELHGNERVPDHSRLAPPLGHPRAPGLRTTLAPPEPLGTPFLPRVSTPGIPGGTSNMNYFHLPLSVGLSGAATPLAAVAGAQLQGWDHTARPSTPTNMRLRHAASMNSLTLTPQSNPDPSTRTSPQHHHSSGRRLSQSSNRSSQNEYDAAPPASPPRMREKSPEDLQVVAHVLYSGDVKMSLTAEILLDYPMPSFVGIPLKLNITGLTFDGVAILAHIRKRAHFCFLSPEDADALVGVEDGLTSLPSDAQPNGHQARQRPRVGGLLEHIKVESEIGDGNQVLKNVGKVESFVLEQVRRIFEDEFVYPSFWTFLV